MIDLTKLLVDGAVVTVVFAAMIAFAMLVQPRWFLSPKNIPTDILVMVPPQTAAEKRNGRLALLPFMLALLCLLAWSLWGVAQGEQGFLGLFAHTFGLLLMPFLFDLLIIDWLVMNTWTPDFVGFPGTEGFAGYKDYAFHARAHLRGLPGLTVFSAILAGLFTIIV